MGVVANVSCAVCLKWTFFLLFAAINNLGWCVSVDVFCFVCYAVPVDMSLNRCDFHEIHV